MSVLLLRRVSSSVTRGPPGEGFLGVTPPCVVLVVHRGRRDHVEDVVPALQGLR